MCPDGSAIVVGGAHPLHYRLARIFHPEEETR